MPRPTIWWGARPIREAFSNFSSPPLGLTNPVSARRLVVFPAPFAPAPSAKPSFQYREFRRFEACERLSGSKKGYQTRALRANSLRTRTGNFLRPCREFKSAIREISALIRESRSPPLFGRPFPRDL